MTMPAESESGAPPATRRRHGFRRGLRRVTRVKRWPMHLKLAVGAWIPVAIVGFFLYTGPNQASGSQVPSVTTTVPAAPAPPKVHSGLADADKVLAAALNAPPPNDKIPQTDQLRAISSILKAQHYARLRQKMPVVRAKDQTRTATRRVKVAQHRSTVAQKTALQHVLKTR